jgi:integrase
MTASARASWSTPYLFIAVPGSGTLISHPLPTDGDPSGLPAGEKLVIRWRAPHAANTYRRTFGPDQHEAAMALLTALLIAHGDPDRWVPDAGGRPLPAPAATPRRAQSPSPTPRVEPTATYAPAADAQPAVPVLLDRTGRTVVSPHNAMLQAVAGGAPLGSTVSDVLDAIVALRQGEWGDAQDTNVRNIIEFVRHLMRYRAPTVTDGPEVTAWKNARLALPGVQVGGSLHVALILTPDLKDALHARRTSDRGVDLRNAQRKATFVKAWTRYTDAVAAKAAGTWRGGRLPARPPEQVEVEQVGKIAAETERKFLQMVRAVLDYAWRNGLADGPNPWEAFAADKANRRRPTTLHISQRHVPTIARVIQIAETIATIGRIDRRTGKPTGARFRALVLTAVASCARPSELWALPPWAYQPGAVPHLVFTGSAGPANKGSTRDGRSWSERPVLKGRQPGEERTVALPRFVADAIEAHLAAGYASGTHLFTSPKGKPVRWANLTGTYWHPAVTAVLGGSREQVLRQMPLRWLRKAGITWLLRSGLDVITVAELAGHDPAILLAHYAGVVNAVHTTPEARREWRDVDAAWAWAAVEPDPR